MNILFLTDSKAANKEAVFEILASCKDNVLLFHEKVALDYLKKHKIDFIFSDRYSYILEERLLDFVDGRAVNVHPSLLPYNRGVQPLFFSILNQTKTGLSFHLMTKQLDQGGIIAQQEIKVFKDDTLRTLYLRSRNTVLFLLSNHWPEIRTQKIQINEQKEVLPINFQSTFDRIFKKLPRGWDSSVSDIENLSKTNY